MTTHRLTFEPEHGGIKHLDCIGTEPELPGVAADVKLAETTYCLDIGNHLLRFLDLPGEASIQFNDISPFADKFIARTIEVFVHSQLAGRIHIEKLEPVTDFTALDAPVPAGVKPFKSWRQDNVPAGFMRGQLLSASVAHSDVYLYARQDGTVVVQAQIDTTGTVTSVKLLKATNSIVANRAMAGIKTWHYRVSYQGDKLVPITLNINLTLPQS
jgi:TonB family protein